MASQTLILWNECKSIKTEPFSLASANPILFRKIYLSLVMN